MSNKSLLRKITRLGKKTPVEVQPPQPMRTLEEIKVDYNKIRSELGEQHLIMRVAETRRDELTQRLCNLHNEYSAAEAKAKEAAAAADPVVAGGAEKLTQS